MLFSKRRNKYKVWLATRIIVRLAQDLVHVFINIQQQQCQKICSAKFQLDDSRAERKQACANPAERREEWDTFSEAQAEKNQRLVQGTRNQTTENCAEGCGKEEKLIIIIYRGF